MSNWFKQVKLSNYNLGNCLGKWLVIQYLGQPLDQSSLEADVTQHASSDPMGVDSATASETAKQYFRQYTKTEPTEQQDALLSEWLGMLSAMAPQLENQAEQAGPEQLK